MTPLVSPRYNYALFYNPKSACSVARRLFVALHGDELPQATQIRLQALRDAMQDDWHDAGQLFAPPAEFDFSASYCATIVRHPYTRFVSAYLNRMVLNRTQFDDFASVLGIKDADATYSFAQVLRYCAVRGVESLEDTHFLPQSVISGELRDTTVTVKPLSWWHNLSGRLPKTPAASLNLHYICHMESLQADLRGLMQHVFRNHGDKRQQALALVEELGMHNVTVVNTEQVLPDAANMSAESLRELGQMPEYAHFLTAETQQILHTLYADDIRLFGYAAELDAKTSSFEQQKAAHVRTQVPNDFNWEFYLYHHPDLRANGVDNKAAAISHWIHHGQQEGRSYKR
ncbi:hypothetical protein GCM10008090_32130 [Arenicella chitinivorans]|uniref:Sulfotransferase family protein n=1 Tax=Arenicella chitinivorans TaxID=1329800 RepID=A0A918VSC6_9GAMM|nr:sulfotransferase family 2 domain-containing protein [Arenicella chitinivorans]GHA19922.1 hypothetical protein GCM10008090_32130 [Arenicella chitinivorans]